MKWIIYWLGIMIIMPLLYLFWWKKRWRLLLGVIIVAVLAISYWAPGELTYSILTREIEKKKPLQQLEQSLRSISDYKPNPSDTEKTKLEKEIIKLKKEIEEANRKKMRGEELGEEEKIKVLEKAWWILPSKQKEWVGKWGKNKNALALLFCGEEFNNQLIREKKTGNLSWQEVKSYNTIDFSQKENNKLDSLQKKLQEICQQEENQLEKARGYSPIIWFKNIDKITNSELKNRLLKVVDPKQNSNLGKYQIEGKTKQKELTVDLSQFTLVATTSAAHLQLPSELRTKLNHIEPFLEKYRWVIFFSSIGVEVIVFLLLIKSWRKSKNKSLKRLEYY